MLGNNKEITAGDNSTNIQGNKVVVNQQNGMDYLQVRQVAMDIFKSNFYDLGEKVEKIVNERAEEIINKYLEQLQRAAPEAISNTADPDLRYSIYEVQKSYARVGNKEISDLLVDVLVERTLKQEESFLKIVLNETLTVIPKLTIRQMDILTIIFIFRYVGFKDDRPFGYLFGFLLPFINDIPTNESIYQHLQYTGCLSLSIGSLTFDSVVKMKFLHLFGNGQNDNEVIKNLTQSNPRMQQFVNNWNSSPLSHASLTSVGIAVAITNIKRKLGGYWDYSIWLKE